MGLLDRRTGEVLRSTRSGRPGARKRKLLPYLLTVAALVLLAPLSAVSPSTAHAQGAVAIQFGDPNNWLSWEVSTGEQPGFQATNYP